MPFFCHGCDNLRASTGLESQSFPVSPVSENCLGPSHFSEYLEAMIVSKLIALAYACFPLTRRGVLTLAAGVFEDSGPSKFIVK